MQKIRYTLLLLLSCLAFLSAGAQNDAYQRYINKYKDIAVEQMQKYGIPASITLAQGLLESGAGQSLLATKANNHFGIKVGTGWYGPYMLKDDDLRDEKFRVYSNAVESYEDHSLFLKNRTRYSQLFRLRKDDYRGWAHGLKAAGYATNPQYAYKLIEIIERYGLAKYDKADLQKSSQQKKSGNWNNGATIQQEQVFACNDVCYIIAQSGDTYEAISKRWKVSKRKLRKYNEVPKGYVPDAGERVYLEKKKRKSAKNEARIHVVKAGESLHQISQQHAIRLKNLYKINRLPETYIPKPDDKLLLR